jgi:hypothetical protein
MKLKITKIVGASTPKGWSQVHAFLPEEKEKLVSRGQFLAVISLSGLTSETEIAAAGREIISRLHEEYYGHLEDRPYIQLKKSLEKIFSEVKEEGKVEICAGALVGEVLFLAIVGCGQVILRRGGETAVILAGKHGGIEAVSGYLKKGDLILMGSRQFMEIIPPAVIKNALSAGSIEEAAEILSPVVYGQKDESLAAALIAQAEEKEEAVVEEIPRRRLFSFLPRTGAKISRRIRPLWQTLRLKLRPLLTRKPARSKKSLLTIVILLFLILGVSLIFGHQQRKTQNWEEQTGALLQQVRQKKEEGEAILSLNPAKSRELLKEAETLLGQIEAEKLTSPELLQMKEELRASLDLVLKEYAAEANLWHDLELMKKGAQLADLSLSSGQVLALDSFNRSVYSLTLEGKQVEILAGGEKLAGVSQLTGLWPKVWVFADEGVMQIDEQSKNVSLAIKADKDWQEIIDLQSFGGNLYLLDQKTIWQYPAAEAGLGGKRNWLKKEGDFSGAQGMAIDGAIWVLFKDGRLKKYLRGVEEGLTLTGLTPPLLSPTAIFTSPEEKYLYLLDKDNSRIVVLNKTGEYDSQYLWAGLKDAQGLVVSEKTGQILVLLGSQIQELKLK